MGRADDRRPFSFGEEPDPPPVRGAGMPGWLKLAGVLAIAAALGAGYLWFVDPALGRRLLRDTPLAPPPAVTRAYKWRDAAGTWQLTDQPPAPGIPYETLEARERGNVMPSERLTGAPRK